MKNKFFVKSKLFLYTVNIEKPMDTTITILWIHVSTRKDQTYKNDSSIIKPCMTRLPAIVQAVR